MKYLLLIIPLIGQMCFSQNLRGLYFSPENDSINFINDSLVKFNFIYGKGLGTNYKGFGSFYFENESLIIETRESNIVPKSTYKTISKISDDANLQLSIVNTNGKIIYGANIVLINNKGRYINGFVLNDSLLEISNFNQSQYLRVSHLGYMQLDIPVDKIKGKKIEILLTEGITLINELVLFKFINEPDPCLYGPYFQAKNKKKTNFEDKNSKSSLLLFKKNE